MKDLFGKAILDFQTNNSPEDLITETTISDEDEMSVAYLFRDFYGMPKLEQQALLLSKGKVLDVGCGMGGLSAMLKQNGINVEALTPNVNQKNHIETKYQGLICHHAKFEDFKSEQKYKTIINSESLQYINLDSAIEHVDKFMEVDGKWIIVDYFRKNQDGINKSGHLEETFLSKIANKGWKITYEKDITLNVLPMSKFIYMYAERFLIPLKHFAFEKLRYKKAWLYYLTENLRSGIDKKMTKEFAAIDPEKFLREKKYAMYVVERN